MGTLNLKQFKNTIIGLWSCYVGESKLVHCWKKLMTLTMTYEVFFSISVRRSGGGGICHPVATLRSEGRREGKEGG